MSEINEINATPEELVEEVELEVEDAEGIPFPIDPTLTHPGEAADAKATGDAIRAITSSVTVNGQSADQTGNISLVASNIPVSNEQGAQTIAEVVEDLQDRDADDIMFSAEKTIKQAVDEIDREPITTQEIDGMMEGWTYGDT